MSKNKLPSLGSPMYRIRAFVVIIVLGLITWLFFHTAQRLDQKKAIAENIKTLPNTKLLGLDSVVFYPNPLPLPHRRRGENTIIFYFDPECEHCQHEAEEVKKQAKRFDNSKLFWLSTEPLTKLRQFEATYALQKTVPQLTIAQISKSDAYNKFGFQSVPTIMVYDSGGKFVKKYVGETKIEALAP